MAAALFGGVLNPEEKKKATPQRQSRPAAARKQPVRKPATTAAAAVSKPPPVAPTPAPPKQEVSLLDFMDDTPAAPPTTMGVLDDPFAAIPSVETSPASVLAPARLSTQDFGSRWGSCSQERRADASPYVRDLDVDFVASKLTAAGAHTVEVIPATLELILAATHLPSSTQILAHVKLLPTRKVTVTVRSMVLSATQESLAALTTALEQAN